MTARTFFLRLGGEVIGPVSAAELRDLARRGGVTPDTPVSGQRDQWTTAGTVRGLVFGTKGSSADLHEPAAEERVTFAISRRLLIGLLLGFAALILLLSLLFVVLAAIPPAAAADPARL